MIIRRCVPKTEQNCIKEKGHASPYKGHFAGEKTAQKILQSGFYLPPLFKDCFEWVKHYDTCQRMSNIRWCRFFIYEGWTSWDLSHHHLVIFTFS